MAKLEKRVALVTGANRGIGLEIARKLAEKGLTVIMAVRDRQKGMAAQKLLLDRELDVHLAHLDVADATSIIAAAGKIEDTFGRLDVLINNAGINIDHHTGIRELSLGLLYKTLETNCFGPLLLSQTCIPVMAKHSYGRIVNISSILGSLTDIVSPESPYSGRQSPAYSLSKTLLNGITALLARDLRQQNILVNAVCPGWTRTDLGGPKASVSPEQAADALLWLATLPDNGPTGGFFREHQPLAW